MSARARWTIVKRSRGAAASGSAVEDVPEIEMGQLCLLNRSEFVYDMDSADDRARLLRYMWTGDYTDALGSMLSANPQLTYVLAELTSNTYTARGTTELQQRAWSFKLEGVLSDLQRIQSQKQIVLWTALSSVEARRFQCPEELWDWMRFMHPGLLATHNWTDALVAEAALYDPGCPYECMPKVLGAVFDNYSRQCKYKMQVSNGVGGYRLDMTNWGTFGVPRSLVPSFDAEAVWRRPWRTDLKRTEFIRLFLFTNVEIRNNKAARFARYMRAAAAGTLFQRPNYISDWTPHITWGEPIWDKLQSEEQHVRDEINHIRRSAQAQGAKVLFIGCDGLGMMRGNTIISKSPAEYLDCSPMVILVQGEAPHGTHHVHHADWRLNWPLIEVCANHLGNRQAVPDPSMKEFNNTLYFRWKVTRAVAEYLNEVAASGGPTTDMAYEFVAACEANVDLAWLAHFLFDGGFLVLQWKEFVRCNDSDGLDLLWREYVGMARTATAHKTHYAPMAVLRVFWSLALCPQLRELYRKIRTLPMGRQPGTNVGWDTPCETLHRAITLGVAILVSQERILKFIREWPFMQRVANGLRQLMYALRRDRRRSMKDMDADVDKLKELFREKVGRTWAEASRPNSSSPKLIGAGWRGKPWLAVRRVMSQTGQDSIDAFITRHLNNYTGFFPWAQ